MMKAESFALWLKQTRERRGLSQGALGERVGKVTRGRVSQWETGEIPPLDKIVLIAQALHVDVTEPLKALGVLSEEVVEVTQEEQEALTLLRGLPDNAVGVARDILACLTQLEGGTARRTGKPKRGASGYNEQSKAG